MVRSTAIAGSGSNDGLWYSSNSGETWTKSIGTTLSYSSVIVYSDEYNAIAGSNNMSNTGLWYSTNSGETWSRSDKMDGGFGSIGISGNYAIAGSNSGMGIWYSDNVARSWIQTFVPSPNASYYVAMDGSKAVSCCTGGAGLNRGLRYSIDYGLTWTKSSSATLSRFNTIAIYGSNVIATSNLADNSGLWYSSDSGVEYVQTPTNNTGAYNDAKFIDSTTVITTRGLGGIYYSLDPSISFTQSSSSTLYINDSSFSGNNLIFGTKTGLWYSSNSGLTIGPSNITTGNFVKVSMSGVYGVACNSSGTGLYYTTNSGQTWAQSTNITTGNYSSVFIVGLNAIASSTTVAGLLYSSNGGETWSMSNFSTNNYSSLYMDGTNAIAYFILGGSFAGLVYSQNSGQTWALSNKTDNNFPTTFLVGSNGLAGSSSSTGIFYTSNGGQTWTQSNINSVSIGSISMSKTSPNAIAGSLSNTGLYYSSDYGHTWTQSNITTGDYISVFILGTNGLAGSSTGLLYSADSGQTWTSTNVTKSINTIQMASQYNWVGGPASSFYTSNICFHSSSMVVLSDYSYKMIKDVKRGDMLLTDCETGAVNKVSRVVKTLLAGIFVKIPKGLLGNTEDIVCTRSHPVWVDNHRRVVASGINGINWIKMSGEFYNIQFDDEETFYVDGVKVDALSPSHYKYKMPEKYFWNREKYDENLYIYDENDVRRGKPVLSVCDGTIDSNCEYC